VTNTDATRRMTYGGGSSCDSSLFGSGTWVRFDSPAGPTIPTSPVSISNCGTVATGWYNGTYPSVAGTSSLGTVCFNYYGNTCSWSNPATVTNCGSFYINLLVNAPCCYCRHCTV